jgi:hypothetical protein
VILPALLYVSCSDIYDNIKEFSIEEIVYPAHFDTIYGRIGYERVEIYLSKAGAIPSDQMNLGKAKKTIIEFVKDGKDTVITYPEVRSWVNIPGLTQPNLYRFYIYTEDEFGDRSVPSEIALTPYTDADKNSLSLPAPSVLSSTTSAQVEWKTNLSSDMYDIFGYSYSYTDKDGNRRDGSGEGDVPSFFIENVDPGEPVSVEITTQIIPKIDKVPILDIIDWKYPVKVTVNGTKPVVFLSSPSMNFGYNDADFPSFSWIKVEEASDYVLKLSNLETFDEGVQTVSIPVGNTDSYTVTNLDKTNINRILGLSESARLFLYWTIVPVTSDTEIVTQARLFRMGTRVIPLKPDASGNSITVTTEADEVYKFVTSGSDPYVYSSTLGIVINPGASSASGDLTLVFEYISYEDATWEFFFSNPNAYGGGSATTDVLKATNNEWKEYVFDIGQHMANFGWGAATNHRFRIDPGDGSYGQSADRTMYLRNMRIIIK